MTEIYTINREGAKMPVEVTEGVKKQRPLCTLIPVTSIGGNDEENRAKNWNKAKLMCDTDIIVRMDGDVKLLDEDAIAVLLQTLEDNPNADATVMPTSKTQQRDKWGHALMAIRRNKMFDLPEHRSLETCATCEALQGLSIIFIDKLQTEVKG